MKKGKKNEDICYSVVDSFNGIGISIRNSSLTKDVNNYSKELNSIIYEIPTNRLRWLVKKDGTKVLQQSFEVKTDEDFKYVWKDVIEEEEEN